MSNAGILSDDGGEYWDSTSVPDHKPMSETELEQHLGNAKYFHDTGSSITKTFLATLQIRFRQAIPEMTKPPPTEGAMAKHIEKIYALVMEHAIEGPTRENMKLFRDVISAKL